MKKILIAFIVLGLAAACNNDQGRNRNDRYDNNRDNRYDNNRDNRNDNNRDNRNDNNYNQNNRNTTGRWSQKDEDDFLTTCENTAIPNMGEAGAKDYCNCTLEKIEKLYSAADIGNLSQTEIQSIARECKNQ
jgi:hypothetical protein